MRKKFAKAAIGISLAVAMLVTSIPYHVLADDNYGDMIELDCPAVYPESKLETLSDMEIKTKVDALLKTMTEDEMYTMLGGSSATASTLGYGTGYVGGVPRLGVPVLRMWDGPKGVISNYKLETTSPASELALASAFSEDLAYKYGELTGTENKATGANVQLGVQLDVVRGPFFRRSRDSMGEDAYLTSILGYQLSKGVQDQHVMTTLKHLACYSETASGRNSDVTVDEQTLHELYLAPYEYIIKNRGASAVMSSYNMMNGEPTSACPYLLKSVLRDMWGFTGLTMTDWGGNYQFSTHLGTDLETGTINRNNKQNIEKAIADGTMTWADVETAVGHTLTAYGEIGYLGLVEVKQDGTAAIDPEPQSSIELAVLEGDARTALLEENDEIALESAVKGSVLLKNDNAALPVDKDDSIAMIGLLADHSLSHISESSWGWLQKMTGAYTEIKEILGENAQITEAVGLDTIGTPVAAENLYTTADCTANGVNVSITTGEETVNKTMDTIRLTTGTIGGKVNRTYKNAADGTALVNGQTATMTAYLKAPATGTYEFEVLKIGGEARVTIFNTEEGTSINGSGVTGGGRGNTGASSWPSTGVVPTAEGMDVPTSTTKLDLTEDEIYKIEVTAGGKIDEKDLQMSLNWFKPADREAQRQAALDAAKNHNKVIYFGYDKGETRATTGNMDLPADQLALLKDVIGVAKENGNQVIVVLNAALPVTMDWLNDADAVLQMWLSGQSGGKAAAQLLTGVENPSGKLPVSWPKSIDDTQYGVFTEGYNAENENNLDYTNGGEGIYSGYRWYDKAGIKPLYAFGYGLSYTSFSYSDLKVAKLSNGYNVTFTVTNTGDVTGSDVAQVYLGKADVPNSVQMAEKKLAAFVRTEDLAPGASKTVTVMIEARELAYWNTAKDVKEGSEKWEIAEGQREIFVSSSADADDIALRTTVDVKDIKFENDTKPPVGPAEGELDCPAVYPEDLLENISDEEIKVKVDALLKTMTEEEIYAMLGGSAASSSALGYGTGYVCGVPRLGVPVLRMWDGPKGVISNYKLETTSPASELALASSFSEDMAYKYGELTGTDNKATAANVQLGVQLDIVRGPFFRRSRDSMGEDAYLTSILGYQLSKGVQDQHVMTTLKHLACYSETASGRNSDVTVDEQTLHELYLAPYEYIIKNKAASAVMSSYNMMNGEPTSACPYLLKTVLRNMWGFTGLTMTDWGGNYQFSTHLGTDLETGTINRNNRENIEAAIADGTMTWADVETAIRHTLTAYGEIGYLGLVKVKEDGTAAIDPDPQKSIELSVLEGQARTNLLEENDKIALESAVKGSVLLKNDNAALPVDGDDSIAMIGLLADHSLNHISESSWGWLQKMTGAYTEIKEILGENAHVTEAVGLDTIGTPVAAENLYTTEACATNGVNVSITTGETTVNKTMDTVRLTTGTIDGKVNRTYKNAADGTALVNNQTAAMTTYLKAPVTGTYEFEVLKIGGEARVTIYDTEEGSSINGSGVTGGGRGNTGASSWPSTGIVPTAEGMDVPTSTTKINLTAGQVYRIEVTAGGRIDEKDLQMSLNWFKPGDRDAQRQAALNAAKNNKKVIYFGYDKGETRATTGNMDLPEDQLDLLKDVITAAKENGNQVIVVLNAALPVTMDWLDDADAVLQMWLSGQSGGKAAAQLLTGVENPSGKLPVSWPKSIDDTQYGVFTEGYNAETQNNLDYTKDGEGIYSGYRWYDKAGIKPLYAFGYGLSYTDFNYSDLKVVKLNNGYNVTFTVTNTGNVTGSDIAQVYLGKADVPGDVQMAEKKLAAFVRTENLRPGESKTVTAKIAARELAYWNTKKNVEEGTEKWEIAEGEREILVSKSAASEDIVLRKTVDVKDIEFTDDTEIPDDELAQEAAKAAAKAAEAAKAAQEAAEAAQAAAENQAALTEIAGQAQEAAEAATAAAEAADKAAVQAAESTKNQKVLAEAANIAQKAANLARDVAQAALVLIQEQSHATETEAKVAEAAKKAAEAVVIAAETQTETAVAQAKAAQEAAEAARDAAKVQANLAAESGAAVKAAAEAARVAAQAAVEAVEKQNADALLQAANAQANAEEVVWDAQDAVTAFEKQAKDLADKVSKAETKADQAYSLAAAAKEAVEAQLAADQAKEAAKKAQEALEAAQAAAKEQTEAAKKEVEDAKKKAEAAQAAADAARKEAEDAKLAQNLLTEKIEFGMKEVNIKSVKSKAKKKLTITWKKVSGAEGYVVQYATKASMKGAKKVTVAKAGTKSVTIKKLKSHKKYYVRVRAYKKIGAKTVYTPYSVISNTKVR